MQDEKDNKYTVVLLLYSQSLFACRRVLGPPQLVCTFRCSSEDLSSRPVCLLHCMHTRLKVGGAGNRVPVKAPPATSVLEARMLSRTIAMRRNGRSGQFLYTHLIGFLFFGNNIIFFSRRSRHHPVRTLSLPGGYPSRSFFPH